MGLKVKGGSELPIFFNDDQNDHPTKYGYILQIEAAQMSFVSCLWSLGEVSRTKQIPQWASWQILENLKNCLYLKGYSLGFPCSSSILTITWLPPNIGINSWSSYL